MKRLGLLVMVALLAACSSNDSKKVDLEPAKLVKIDDALKLKVLWSHDVGDGAGEYYDLLPIAVVDNSLFATTSDGTVVAYEADTGRKLWDMDLDVQTASGVGAADGLVLLGTNKGQVIALNATDGSEAWRAQLSSEVLAPPQSNGKQVAVQTLDGRVYGLDAADGSELWMFESSVPALTLRGTSTPIITADTVYAGFATGKLVSLTAKDGITRWERRIAAPQGRSELERVIDINGSPLMLGENLYVGSYQGRLVALQRNTGRGLWAKPESTFNNLAAGDGNVYVSTAEDSVKAYNAFSGTVVWENDQLVRRQLGAPQAFGDYVAVADAEGYLHILRQSDGEFVARRKVDGDGVRTPMVSVGDVLYVYGNSGDLEAITIR